jgi:glycosyltransferase involved in cell wall biosynthesis
MRVLIPWHGFITWNGGVDLLRVIVTAVRSVAAEYGVEQVFALPPPPPASNASATKLYAMAREVIGSDPFVDGGLDARAINRAAVAADAQIVFPTMLPIRTSHVKKVGYFYDFQHRDLPQYFSAVERERRDWEFVDIAERSHAVFCTSQSVAAKAREYLGVAPERMLVMPYTPWLQPAWLDLDVAAAQATHATGQRYLLVCNHFWLHKDHATALRAFAAVAADPRHADLKLVMTGDTSDFRDPSYFGRLQGLIDALGLRSRCRILGMIPKAEQIALLRGAALLLQPTLYEGGPGGGASYEAGGLGVPALLSDIAVNQEAAIDTVRFFKAGDATHCAGQISAMLAAPAGRPSNDELLARSAQRLRTAGTVLVERLRQLVD